MSSQMSLFDGQHKFVIDKPIRLIELFAGIGAQAKALERLGVQFEHYRICEFDKYAVTSYNAIHGTYFKTSDICKIKAEDLGVVDTDKYCYIMTYSFPCTDLSVAGKQAGMSKGTGTRSGLLWEVERLLREMKELPQILLMENVPQVIGQKNIKDFADWISFLDGLGYKSKWEVLNAKDFNVPQNRERCFMVSWQGDYYYSFPKPIKLQKQLKYIFEEEVDEHYFNVPPSMIKALETGKVILLNDREHSCSVTCKNDRWHNVGLYEQNGRIRYLTEKEVWRLMDFDDKDYEAIKNIPCGQRYKQAGNSIVVAVLEAIFKQML